ncbi:MAG: ATP-dependent DNA helicase [Minisyncoccia bacterium]
MAKFEEAYARLNAEQRRAVDATEGPVMVIAGPGTGKTEILTLRIANILRKTKVAPEKILALTFTESGVTAMRRRLTELVSGDAYRVAISTFHGFANSVIKDSPDHFLPIIGSVNITEIDQVQILERLLDDQKLDLLRPFGDRYYYLRNILSAINELKQQGVSPEAFAKIAAEEKKDFYANPDLMNQSGKYEGKMKTKYASASRHVLKNIELADIYAGYQAALRKAKQYDYSDMIMEVMVALEKDSDLLRILQDAHDYILVDEHQDTNDAQNRIIELLAGGREEPNLFVVGDEKQAIFRFQGASIENFHYFKNRYKKVELISLRNNYRSTQAILNAAETVSPRETKLVAQVNEVAAPVSLAALSSPDAEHYFIAQKIEELQDAGTPAEEIAVLYHDNREAAPLARMLEKEHVPFNIESNQDVLGDPEIKKLIRILRAVEHFGSDSPLVEALHVDFSGIPPIDVYKLAAFARKGRIKIYDVLRAEKSLEAAGVGATDACLAFFENLSAWKTAAKNRGAAEAFESVVRESGFLAALLRHPSATEKIAKLHALFDVLKSAVERQKNYTLDDFFAYLGLLEKHDVAIKNKEIAGIPDHVRLMTAHRSKGLEFAYVFIMNAADRTWGSRFHREAIKLPKKIYRVLEKVDTDLAGGDDDADERNLFYVALTRAKKGAFITFAKTDRDGKEVLPTQFIAEMKEDILARQDVSRYEKYIAAHPEIEFAPSAPKTPELKDKEFLSALFDEQGLSPTALNNYLACPWQYFYRNLIRIPEAPNKSLAFGTAVHAALSSYFDAVDAGEEKGEKYFIARFEEELSRQPIPQDEYDDALLRGRKVLAAYYGHYHDGWAVTKGKNEVKIDGVEALGVKVNGKLDRILFAPGSGEVTVIDYKTGQPKSRNELEGVTKDASGDYKRQLTFYKLLLAKQGMYDMKQGIIDFVQADDRGNFHREPFDISDGEAKDLETKIGEVAEEIKKLAFWDKIPHAKDCDYCALRRLMA